MHIVTVAIGVQRHQIVKGSWISWKTILIAGGTFAVRKELTLAKPDLCLECSL